MWSRSPKQCRTMRSNLGDIVTAQFDARALKVQLPLETLCYHAPIFTLFGGFFLMVLFAGIATPPPSTPRPHPGHAVHRVHSSGCYPQSLHMFVTLLMLMTQHPSVSSVAP